MEIEKIPIIVICGPTASGKTALGLMLSEEYEIEFISADSRQIYKYLNIGTAKPTPDELAKVPHHFIDMLDPSLPYSAGEFGDAAYSVALDIHKRGKLPVVVGGSGLYIQSLCDGLFKEEGKVNLEVRQKLENDFATLGVDVMYEKLKQLDRKSYELYYDKNPRRILRALEFYHTNNISLSEMHEIKTERNLIPQYFQINIPRDLLYERINKRVEIMWEMGLVKETEQILSMGYSENINALNTVGYKEVLSYLRGEISKDTAINEIQKNTRHYAKRQLTWNRQRLKEINSINNYQELKLGIEKGIKSK